MDAEFPDEKIARGSALACENLTRGIKLKGFPWKCGR